MATSRAAAYKLEFRAYRRNFLRPWVTAQGVWTTREGAIVRLTDGEGRIGYGEAVPLPHFTTETTKQDLTWLRRAAGKITRKQIQGVPEHLSCVRWAMSCAVAMVEGRLNPPAKAKKLSMTALLPAGAAAVAELARLGAEGYQVFKWKVGVKPLGVEILLLEKLLKALPKGAKLRLDANGTLSRPEWKTWCDGLKALGSACNAIEFFEQPWKPTTGLPSWHGLARLAEAAPVPVALDESVAGLAALQNAQAARWRGPFVVKPALLGDWDDFIRWRSKAKAKLVYSSALETSVGLHANLCLAATDPQADQHAFGYGMVKIFAEDGLLLPAHRARPKLAPGKLSADDFEELWNRLA